MFKSIKHWYDHKIKIHNLYKRKRLSNISSRNVNIKNNHYFMSRAMVTDIPDILFISNHIFHQNIWNKKMLLHELQSDSNRIYFVIRHNDELVGFGGFYLMNDQKMCKIIDILVIPRFNNYGLQKYILSTIIDKIKMIHFKSIDFTINNNGNMQRLTEQFGFEVIDSNKNRTKMKKIIEQF